MTATDELRKLLDERGVSWDYGPSGASSTAFWVNGKELSFSNCRDGLVCSTIFTPAQAIAATLGDSDATRARQDGAIDDALIQIADWHHDHLSEHAEECETDEYGGLYWVIGRDVSDDLDNLIIKAQNLAATLGAGTCHMRLAYEEEDADGFIWPDHYECDACGASVNGIMPYYDTEIPPKFCPNCGRRVVRE